MKRRIHRPFIVILIAVLAAACTPGGGSIYFTLENEVKVEDGSLPNAITVFDVAKVGTRYYAAAGKIWSALVSAPSFQVADTVDPPDSTDNQLCTALAAYSGELFGGFINQSGNLGLFSSTSLAFTPSPISDSSVSGADIALLKVQTEGTDKLVIVTARPPSPGDNMQFGVVVYDGVSYTPLPFVGRSTAEAEQPINDVIYSPTLGCWMVTEGTKLYSDASTAGTLEPVTGTTGLPTDEKFVGLFDAGSRIYLAAASGSVYHSTDGLTWAGITATEPVDTPPPLTRFAGPFGTKNTLIVGSDGYGYYLLATNPLGALVRFGDSTIDLHGASVQKVVIDGTTVFALTSMGGLWRGSISGDAVVGWKQE
jgi:hypothetical protein